MKPLRPHQKYVVNRRVDEAGFDGDDRDQKREDGDDNGCGRDCRSSLLRSTCCSTGSSSAVAQRDLMGVDAESEKLICNFYKGLNMEHQESSEEYHTMLARGC